MITKTKPRPRKAAVPTKHHLDRRVDQILAAAAGGDDSDALLDTIELAEFLGMSRQWVEVSRCQGVGPPFVRVGIRTVRYRKADVLKWLDARARATLRKPVAA